MHVRAGVLIGVLTAILGFAIAVQVHSNSSSDNLASAREDDLIRILDDQNARAERLNQQIADLQRTLDELRVSGNSDAVAQQQAEQEVQALRVLLGTLPVSGPGVLITITDPQHKLKAEDLLDVVEELRGAGAESLQFGSVRVGTSTSFSDTGASVSVDQTSDEPALSGARHRRSEDARHSAEHSRWRSRDCPKRGRQRRDRRAAERRDLGGPLGAEAEIPDAVGTVGSGRIPSRTRDLREVIEMADIPDDLKYTADHEWARVDDATIRVGVTDYAQEALGDVVYVSLPEVGAQVRQGEAFGEVESTKSVSDLNAPVTGTVTARNDELDGRPELINSDPYGEGWIVEIEAADPAQVDGLLDPAAYGTLSA